MDRQKAQEPQLNLNEIVHSLKELSPFSNSQRQKSALKLVIETFEIVKNYLDYFATPKVGDSQTKARILISNNSSGNFNSLLKELRQAGDYTIIEDAGSILKGKEFDLIVALVDEVSVEIINYLEEIITSQPVFMPCIVVYDRLSFEAKLMGLKAGVNQFLPINCDPRELLAFVAFFLQQKKKIQESILKNIINNVRYSSSNRDQLLIMLDQIIEDHIDELDVNKICREINYSRSHLCRKIKQLTGLKLTEYVNSYKLEKSITLLMGTDWKISRIADSLGFCSQQYYANLFAKKFGISPSKYRKHRIGKLKSTIV